MEASRHEERFRGRGGHAGYSCGLGGQPRQYGMQVSILQEMDSKLSRGVRVSIYSRNQEKRAGEEAAKSAAQKDERWLRVRAVRLGKRGRRRLASRAVGSYANSFHVGIVPLLLDGAIVFCQLYRLER